MKPITKRLFSRTLTIGALNLILLIFTFQITPVFGQSPISQIVGHLEVWNVDDSTSVFVGQEAGFAIKDTIDFQNTFVGYRSGKDNTGGHSNSFYGAQSGERNTLGYRNSFFGEEAGRNNRTGVNNAFFGKSTGSANGSGRDNSFFGAYAGFKNTTGENNSFFGYFAARDNTDGSDNSFFGEQAGFLNTSGSGNVFIGQAAGLANTQGSENTYIGRGSGRLSGDRNICIGRSSGPSSANSNFSDRLYIDVIGTDDPLIYGEFDNNLIRINGSLDVTDGISGVFNCSSDVNLKENFKTINHEEILEKVLALSISEWNYMGNMERHVGPMAQDFYGAFSLGKGDTTIATVDADGVALASIQALYAVTKLRADAAEEKILTLEQELSQLRVLVNSLIKGKE